MILGITASQSGLTSFQREELKKLIELYKPNELCHGDCIGGDSEANQLAIESGIRNYSLFPSVLTKKRAYCFTGVSIPLPIWEWMTHTDTIRFRLAAPKPPLERNEDIVNYCDKLIACPKESRHTVRSGTWHSIRLAWKRQKKDPNFKVVIIPPLE
jgi:hypothetical protein